MARFKDNKGRDWDVIVDVPNLKLVRERCHFELGKLLADNFKRLDELAEDPVLLVDVLFVLCEEQAKEKKVAPEEFGRSLTGDAIGAAYDALRDAYADFCPSQRAKPLRALAEKIKAFDKAVTEKALAAVEGLDVEALLTTSNRSAGNAAVSVVSIPAPEG